MVILLNLVRSVKILLDVLTEDIKQHDEREASSSSYSRAHSSLSTHSRYQPSKGYPPRPSTAPPISPSREQVAATAIGIGGIEGLSGEAKNEKDNKKKRTSFLRMGSGDRSRDPSAPLRSTGSLKESRSGDDVKEEARAVRTYPLVLHCTLV